MATVDIGLLKKYARNMSVLFLEEDKDTRIELFERLHDIFPNIAITGDKLHALENYNEYYYSQKKYYDLIISDMKNSQTHSIKFIEEIYKINSKQIIIIFSACIDSAYLITLLNLGIESFFVKPLDFSSFLKDIMQICNTIYISKNEKQSIVKINKTLTWNKEEKVLTLNDKEIKLTKKEIILLDILIKKKNILFTAEELINILWFDTFNIDADINNLKNIISRLRKKVPNLNIINIYGLGYKLNFQNNLELNN